MASKPNSANQDGPIESNVVPTRKRAASFTSLIAALEVGHSTCRLQTIDPECQIGDVQASIVQWRADLRNNIAPSVRNARAETQGEYTVEIADFLTDARNWHMIGIVTRVA